MSESRDKTLLPEGAPLISGAPSAPALGESTNAVQTPPPATSIATSAEYDSESPTIMDAATVIEIPTPFDAPTLLEHRLSSFPIGPWPRLKLPKAIGANRCSCPLALCWETATKFCNCSAKVEWVRFTRRETTSSTASLR